MKPGIVKTQVSIKKYFKMRYSSLERSYIDYSPFRAADNSSIFFPISKPDIITRNRLKIRTKIQNQL